MRRLFLTAIVAAASASPLAAQGSISLQGFGYPTGQLSSRASATGGALAEMDPASPINPASLPNSGRSIFAFQYDPEWRSITAGGRTVNTLTARFPAITIGARLGVRGFLAASFSTLLDRTWDAAYNDTVLVGGDKAASTVSAQVRGAINDARIAFAWQFTERLQAGVGLHAFTGANRIVLERTFSDSTTYGALSQRTTLAYQGTGFSAGVIATPSSHLAVAASLRMGGSMKTRYDDKVATEGNAPTRYGVSFTYDGIPGSSLALRVNHDQWSRMRSLSSRALDVHDATEIAGGAEINGPKVQGQPSAFRLGLRTRDLPFGWNGHTVTEKTFSIGGGFTFARGWASLDASLQQSTRSTTGLSEKGRTLSVGLTVRP